jgi:hypothetical protein
MSTPTVAPPTTPTARGAAEDNRDEWIRLRKAGHSYRQIGEKFGFSHEMVRQIIGSEAGTRINIYAQKRAEMREKLRDWLNENGPVARSELFDHFGINGRQFLYYTREDETFPEHLVLLDARPTEAAQSFSDDEVFDSMRAAWADVQAHKPLARGLSHVLYERHRSPEQPSSARIIGRYLTWAKACALAEIPSGDAYRPTATYSTAWTADALLDAVGRYLEDCAADSRKPTYTGYDVFQRDHDDLPSGTTVRLRLKGEGHPTWPSIVAAAREHAQNSGTSSGDE